MSLVFLEARSATEKHHDSVWGLSWTAQDTVISISADGAIRQWASATGQPYPPNAPPPKPHTLGLTSLSVSRDGRKALYNSIEGTTRLWDVAGSGEIVGTFESFAKSDDAQSGPSWSVSLHPEGETYASTGSSGNVTLHDARPGADFGRRLSSISSGRNKFGLSCVFAPDGKRVAMGSETGQIYLFDVESGMLANTYTSHAMGVRSLAWSADSQLLLSASEDKRMVLHDVRKSEHGGSVTTFTGHSSWVLSADISVDGRYVLSGSADRTVKVWDMQTRAAVSTIAQDGGEVWSVAWNKAGSANGAFVSGSDDGSVKWYRVPGAGDEQ
ncbi:WD40 repeat-like protein [Schizophyllum commune H4-8]|uniref:Uncharacterized protein n=1 Tax=Schizophyllum commune (strain H4-8 / FGSC 9210) TaxID=578458 RepID=D8PV58_SCHCM|nr:WD40 repeat-like protein [Schizophyllum commune H4-8]KAI5900484.1 WD40 repeat-like protein [Schizophyllum commune H4-8]